MSRLAEIDIGEQDGVPVARIRGELDLSNAGDIADALEVAVGPTAPGLVVDMTGLRHIDSAGVRILFDLRGRLAHRRQRLALVVPDDAPIKEVLTLVSVAEAMPVCTSAAGALEQVRSRGAA